MAQLDPATRTLLDAISFAARAHHGPGASEQRYRVQTLTAKLVSELAADRSWAKGSPLVDPLAKEAGAYVYRVVAFDVLSVIVWDHPELTIPAGEFRSVESAGNVVLADGTIFYPHVGTVEVAGGGVTAEVSFLPLVP